MPLRLRGTTVSQAARDGQLYTWAVAIMLAVLYRAPLTEGERWRLAGLAAFMAAQLAFLTCWRRQYLRWRTPLVAVSRAQGLLVPVLVLDTLRALQPTLQPSPAAGGDGMGSSSSGGVAAALRSVVVLLVPLAWVDACFLGAVGHPLPPLLHVAVQSVSMGLLAWRAPTACRDYVAQHPSNPRVVQAAYWLLQQLTSLLCGGTQQLVALAGGAVSDGQQCVAVVWALQASLALVLPTLVIWQQQLATARQAAGQMGRQEQREREAGESEQHAVGDCHRKSLVAGIELRLLEAAEGISWPLATAASALLAFAARLAWQALPEGAAV